MVRNTTKVTTVRSFTALLLLAAALAFIGVVVVDAPSSSGEYDQIIIYEDDEGDNSDVSIGYYGIAATEYNPEFWSGTGYVGKNVSNWTGPDADSVTVSGFTISIRSLGALNKSYTITFPTTHTVTAVSPGSIGSDGHSVTFTQSSDITTVSVTFSNITITPKKVFGGWVDEDDELVLPGDVVKKDDDGVTHIKARWITPDVFVLKSDWVNWDYMRDADGNKPTTTQLEAVSPYAYLGLTSKYGSFSKLSDRDGKLGILNYDTVQTIDGHPNSQYIKLVNNSYDYGVRYNYVIRGDDRTDSDMFGTIYHLTNERTKEQIFYGSFGSLTTYPNAFSAGTYRTPDTANSLKPTLMFNESGSKTGFLSGNVIIDNVVLGAAGPSNHGDGTSSTLFASGNILIMGTNIECKDIKSSKNGNLWTVTSGAPQIFGGKLNANITNAVDIPGSETDEKEIVFGDGEEHDLKVKLGTYVIIHSGIYSNIVAGSFGKDNKIGVAGTNPLSTYIVLKGGSTIDTVVGGFGGVAGTVNGDTSDDDIETGGTFIYVVDHFTPGDDWEDTAFRDSKEYGRDTYKISQSSIMEGGSSGGSDSNGVVYGSTHVFLTGTSSVWDVQAGGRTGTTHADSTYLEITGKAVVRHIACGTITDGASGASKNCVDAVNIFIGGDAVVAGVYGAGYDTTFYPSGKSMTGGKITMVMAGGKVGNLYGGGYRGSIGDESNPNNLKITITIKGGEVLENVYGGGSGGLDKIKHTAEGAYVAPAKDGYLYSMGRSYVYGNISLTISDAKVYGNVYGGGMSVPKLLSYSAGTTITGFVTEMVGSNPDYVATVEGNVEVHIKSGANIAGSVYGAGRGIECNYTNGKWVIDNYTESTVVDVSKIDSSDPFTKLPWFINSDGGYTYTYDTGSLVTETSGSEYLKYDSNHIIKSGYYLDFARVIGNTSVFIDGGTIGKDVYGGGAQGKVYGSTSVQINGGSIQGNVFGGGLGVADIVSVSGNRGVYVSGSTTRIKGSVYGSSSMGDDGPKKDFHIRSSSSDSSKEYYADSTVVIDEALIDGSIFGGGFLGKTYGSTYIYVGYTFARNIDGTYSIIEGSGGDTIKTIKVSSIYAGGNVSTSASGDESETTVVPFSDGSELVQGHGVIHIHGHGDSSNFSISGSIMGSGNSCNTGMSTSIEIIDLQNKTSMTGIHRADEVLISQSYIDITGRSTVTDSKTASLYKIGSLTLKYDTTLKIYHPADDVHELHSVNMYDKPTTPGSPSNSIIFTGGSTFYVRDNSTGDYGVVTGNVIMSVEGQSSYGAYVMCRPDSPGAFVITKEGTFTSANMTDFNADTRCWFIGGTEKKVITLNLQAASDRGLVQTTDDEKYVSVEIMKMFNGTSIEYVGGSFTSLGSDGFNDYTMVKPGMNGTSLPGTNEFGLIITDGGTLKPHTTMAFEEFDTDGIYFVDSSNVYEKFDSGLSAGPYSLMFKLTGAPEDRSAYLGYAVLGFREVREVIEDGITYTVPANYIEVRVDMYVTSSGSGSEFDDTEYTVKIKTETSTDGEVTHHIGYSDVLFPKTGEMGELTLESVYIGDDPGTIPAGAKVIISAMANQDNTTGWMIPNLLELTDTSATSGSIGALSGSSVATIRYYVDYTTNSAPENIRLVFKLTAGQNTTYSTIGLNIEDKGKVSVTFKDIKGEDDKTVEYYYGSKLAKAQCPNAGDGFVGWYTDSTYSSPYNHEAPLTKNLTLYARYMYTVTFDNMDGTTSKLYLSQTIGGTKIGADLLPVLDKAGYEFGGWFKDRDYIYEWDPTNDLVTQDITLYAKWTGVAVKVNFYYGEPGNWIKVETNETYHDYVMKVVKEVEGGKIVYVPIYPTVKMGSSFDVIDPSQNGKNILDYVQSLVMTHLGYDKKFIRWQAYSGNDSVNGELFAVYHDTILEGWMVDLIHPEESSGLPIINLYAVTSTVAIKVVMDKHNWPDSVHISDESAIVSPPSSFFVYPDDYDGSADVIDHMDERGNHYFSDRNVLTEFYEVDTETTDGNDEVVLRYLDSYGNVWKNENNTYVLVRSIVYVGDESVSVAATEEFPDGYHFKDRYGNEYTRANDTKPSNPDTDTYVCADGSSNVYYKFTYTLNDATLSGHRLVSWHNIMITDPDALHPRPGSERTLKIFFEEDGNDIVVVRTILDTTDAKGNEVIIELDDGEGRHIINSTGDEDDEYKITYRAEWNPLEYSVSISPTSNGVVDAFIIGSDGKRVHVEGTSVKAHYGDLIEVSYTPLGYYQFNKWVTSGECTIDDTKASSTTVLVTGNCSIIANDIGDRSVRLNIIIDADAITPEELAKTKVFMHKKDTAHEYYEMALEGGTGYKTFKNYVPLGQYEVCLRYGTSTDYEEYALLGTLDITADSTTTFTYYVISASIIPTIKVIEDGVEKTYDTTPNYETSIVSLTKYVGALDSLIFGQSQDLIINNPAGKLPAVEITIAPGYDYLVFEGFPDIVGDKEVFILNKQYNYHTGKTDQYDAETNPTGTKTETFHLNWTKYDKPAFIIVQTTELKYEVKYTVGTETKPAQVKFGEQLIAHVPEFPLDDGKMLGGWFFDSGFDHQVTGNYFLDNSVIDQAKSGTLELFGKVIEGEAREIFIDIYSQDISGDSYSFANRMNIPLLKQNDIYAFNFPIKAVAGMTYSDVEEPAHISTTAVGEVLRITADEDAWSGAKPILKIYYDRNVVQIAVTNNPSQIASGAWEPGKTAVYEEEVPLPIMKKNENGDSISYWSSTPMGAHIINRDGVYYYKVGANDPGEISFTATYPPKTISVTFITPIGYFDDPDELKLKRIVTTVESGHTVSEPTIVNPDHTIYQSYEFYDGETGKEFDFSKPITSDKTVIAEWTVNTYDLWYKSPDKASVSISINKEYIEEDGWTKYDLEYRTEVAITINPDAGYDLDLDATFAASTVDEEDIGTPVKLSNNRGYIWTFFVTEDTHLDIRTKAATANINFVINGSKVSGFNATEYDVEVPKVYVDGKNIPLYTTVTFGEYNGRQWFKSPDLTEPLPFILDGDDNKVYILAVEEDISLYSTSNIYHIYYHSHEGSELWRDDVVIEGSSGTAVLRSTPAEEEADHIFVGWAVMDIETGDKVFTYKPAAEIELDASTSTRIDLYAFCLEAESVECVYDGKQHYSSVVNPDSKQKGGEYQLRVRYATTELNAGNYNTVGNSDASAISFKDPGVYTVYFYGEVRYDDHGVMRALCDIKGSYTIRILDKNLVTFINDGQLVGSRRVADNIPIGDPPIVAKEGYELDGWYTDSNVKFDFVNGTVTSDTRLTAKWIKLYSVTIDPDNGSEPSVSSVSEGTVISCPEDPIRNGYRFLGWYDGDNAFDFTQGITKTTVITARWIQQHTVTFDPDNGQATWQVIVDHDSTVTHPMGTPTKEPTETVSYTFEGWHKMNGAVMDANIYDFKTKVTADMVIKANWLDVPAHVVSIYIQRGPPTTPLVSETSFNVYDGEKVIIPEGTPEKQRGLLFDHWDIVVLRSDFTIESRETYDLNTPVHSDINLVPVWSHEFYNVTFDMNGGSGPTSSLLAEATVEYTVTASYAGHRFLGWSYERNGDPLFDETGKVKFPLSATVDPDDSKTVTLYAVWIEQYDVTIDDGVTTPQVSTVDRGTVIERPADPEREGYQFDGWFDGDTEFDFTQGITKTTTISAKWLELHTVTFDSNGGSAIQSVKVAHGKSFERPADPTKESQGGYDYGFAGWFQVVEEQMVDQAFNFNAPVLGDITIKAKWTERKAPTANFYSMQADGVPILQMSFPVYSGETLSRPTEFPQPVRGLDFLGWHVIVSFNEDKTSCVVGDMYTFGQTISQDVHLVTQWELKEYNITFDKNGGTGGTESITVTANIPTHNYTAPTYTGHKFVGWALSADGDVVFKDTDNIRFPLAAALDSSDSKAVTLYAKWIETHIVTFDSAGGSAVASQEIAHGLTASVPTEPTKQHPEAEKKYVFGGWYIGENAYMFNTPVNSNITLTAKWIETNRYVASFYSQFGGSAPELKNRVPADDYGKVAKPADPPEQDRLTFLGWYTFTYDDEGRVVIGSEFDFVNTVLTADIDLIANWNPDRYTIKFDTDDGGSVPDRTNVPVFGGPIALPTEGVQKTNYRFAGWSLTEGGDVLEGNELNRPLPVCTDSILTLYAIWIPQYTVTFDPDNTGASWTVKVDANTSVSRPANDPVREGYDFRGWCLSTAMETTYNFNTAVTGNITIQAKWEEKRPNIVSFYSLPASGIPELKSSATYRYNETVTSPGDPPEQRGIVFAGWFEFTYDDDGNIVFADEKYTFGQTVSKDTNIITKWVPKTYTVTFHANGGEGSISDLTVKGNAGPSEFDSSTVYRDGYRLLGWSLDSAATTAQFEDRIAFPISKSLEGDVTDVDLFAVWVKQYTVTIDPDNGEEVETEKVDTGGYLQRSASEPFRDGFRFLGWYNGDELFDFSAPITGDVTVKAKWIQLFTVTFSTGDRAIVATEVVEDGGHATRPDDPTKAESRFVYWYQNSEDEEFDFDTEIRSDVLLTAKWTALGSNLVKFYGQAGDAVKYPELKNTVDVFDGNTVSQPETPVVPRLNFLGWYTFTYSAETGIVIKDKFDFSTPITDDLELIINWQPDIYTIHFDANGGAGMDIPDMHEAVFGAPIPITGTMPSWKDHAQIGWSLTPDGPVAYTDKITRALPVYESKVMNLYAVWVEGHRVTFDSDGGSEVDAQDIPDGGKATKPEDPTRTGYRFLGWYLGEATEAFDFNTVINEDITLKAKWFKLMVVTFETSGGTEFPVQYLEPGSKAQKPADPVREGYVFDYWYLSGHEDTEYDFNTPVESDITIVAKWIPAHVVAFNSNGGSHVQSQSVLDGNKAQKPSDPTKEGYAFDYWYLADEETAYDFDTLVRSDITLNAKWIKIHAVTFDSNGGSPVQAQSVLDGHQAAKPADPTREGYEFRGWTLNGNQYDFSAPVRSDITLKASWYSDSPQPAPHNPDKIIDKDTEIIHNHDGSTTEIDKETIIDKDGSTVEKVKESTVSEDGSAIVTKESTTKTDRYGNTTTETKESMVVTDEDGNTTTDTVTTVTEADSSSKIVQEQTTKDDAGRLVDTKVNIIDIDADGNEQIIQIRGDTDKIEAYMPDTELSNLHEAESVFRQIVPKEVTIVFETEGEVVIPKDYLREASIKEYGIAVQNNSTLQAVEMDRSVVQMLSKKGQDAVFSVKKVDSKDLTERQRAIIHDNYAMSLIVTVGDAAIHELGGEADITILCDQPYDHVYYVSDNGNVEEIPCKYDEGSRTMTFTLTHFSVYTLTVGPMEYGSEGDNMMFIVIAAVIGLIVAGIVVLVAVKKR